MSRSAGDATRWSRRGPLGQRDIALDHVERRVAEDPLEAEHVAAVDEVAPGERVAERVGAAPPGDPGPHLQTLEDLLHPPPVEGSAPAEEERRVGRAGTALAEVANDRPRAVAADRHDPFLRALAHDLERAVRPQIAQAQAGRLGDPQARVEEEQEDRPVADVGDREQPPQRIVADRLDELVGDSRLAERPERRGLGELLGREPVAEDLERPDVAGDADRGEGRPELEEPGPKIGPGRRSTGRSAPSRADRPARGSSGTSSSVLAEAPSAAFARRNRSTARPRVRCSKESVAHVRGRPESGAQRSGESGAQSMSIASLATDTAGRRSNHKM